MRLLIDTNVVLDLLQERKPFVEDAARLFERQRLALASSKRNLSPSWVSTGGDRLYRSFAYRVRRNIGMSHCGCKSY
ncbi:hypothetical protein NUACC26_029390 [Scytonema sp. NUACC26]